jgi:hypothetical protein
MIDQQIEVDPQVQQTIDRITSAFDDALAMLIARLNRQYGETTKALDAERATLVEEYACIEQASANLKAILPAKQRLLQHEADHLLVEGKSQEAQVKLAEMQKALDASNTMSQRQGQITHRIHEIDAEKKAIARTIFNESYGQCQHIVRGAEHGLFCVLLDGLQSAFFDYQQSTDTGTADNRQRPLIQQGHITGLTADERSIEWRSGQRWYGGRR